MDSMEKLKRMGAKKIDLEIRPSGILTIKFRLNGVDVSAQADIDNEGIYAIKLETLDDLEKLLEGGAK
jgi:hypothetical protein